MRKIATLLAMLLLSSSLALAVDLKPNPPDCPKGPDGKPKYRCLTLDEYAAITEEYLTTKARLDKLEWQRNHFGGNYLKPWMIWGVERLPNDGQYHPFGIAGVDIGRVNVWAGSFGDTPAYGIGWRIWPQ